jgi:hypothetical protein
MSSAFDPNMVNLTTANPVDIICYIYGGQNDYDGRLGERVGALFVILILSTAVTFFPVVAARVAWLRINIYVYLFARYFGAGVIIATAFIQYVPLPSSISILSPSSSTSADPMTVSLTRPTAKSVLIRVWE